MRDQRELGELKALLQPWWAADDQSLLASPTLSGIPAAPTAAVDTNTTQVATTAFVIGQGYLKTPSFATYTPTWTASGTAPAIGNATVVARYAAYGKLIFAYGRITFGTTSTFGTGSYSFALPVAASASATATVGVLGSAYILDSSSGNTGSVLGYYLSASAHGLRYPATYLGVDTAVSQLAPWTWATGDVISWNFMYEAA